MKKDKKNKPQKLPFVSICTPTFNRRPFIPYIIKCFQNQTYPKDKMEWIIVDDGTDKIEDLVSHIPQVKYYKFDEKMTLGKKRNLTHKYATGDVLVYMDDDDYYPPERVMHAIETLNANPKALCVGSSEMHIYFKHINKMYQFGPYTPNHATAATFAFHKRLLDQTSFSDTACVAEEKHFLKNYTIPFAQLDPVKTILVFSHIHNSFDKKKLLEGGLHPLVKESSKNPHDFVKEPEMLKFFIDDVNSLLDNYKPGDPINKPDVLKQIKELAEQREQEMKNNALQSQLQNQTILNNPVDIQNKFNEMCLIINNLTSENEKLKSNVNYLEDKIKKLIGDLIEERKKIKFSS